MIKYLPILTTVISAGFAMIVFSRYLGSGRTKPHLLWWAVGVAVYGVGTVFESLISLSGWSVFLFKGWYISGALLGGGPLAIGTIYLLFGRKFGDLMAGALIAAVSITSVFVILSPLHLELVDPHLPNGKVLGWQEIRKVSPFINGLAALFLIGGALYSAFRFLRHHDTIHRFYGNLFIAIGATLPGIGGYLSRRGYTEGLYIGEFVGIILIWAGYKFCQKTSGQRIASDSNRISRAQAVT